MSGELPARLAAALGDRYRLERELGAGGMATVYLAADLKHDRKVAIKVLKPELAAVLGAERFVQEIRTTAQLQHPHVLPLFDSGEAGGFLYYVMPYIQGETIREKLNRETQFGVEEAVRIATQVADALDYAHRHGVIHRDIKPENILLHDGRPMVMDFGIALAVSAAAGGRMTETGLSLGTPHYMSPEQATADKQITARSDVYSLASVLYEMLAGEPPHMGTSAQQIIMKIITETVSDVQARRKSVPANVAAALNVALEKLPADRFESARAFAEALELPSFSRGRPGLAVGAGAGGRGAAGAGGGASGEAGEWRRTLRHPLTLGMAVIALGAVAVALRGALVPSAAKTASVASAVRFSLEPPTATRYALSNAGGPLLAVSPDGSTLVFAAADAQGGRRLYTRRLDSLAIHPLEATDSPSSPFFSPDGAFVAFYAAGRLQRVAVAGGAPQLVAPEATPIAGGTWTADGNIVFSPTGSPVLHRVLATGGTPEPAAALDSANGETQQFFPLALPDGTHVLYMSWGSGGLEDVRIGLLDLKTGRSHRLAVTGTTGLGVVDGRLVYGDLTGALLSVPLDLATGRVTGTPTPLGIKVATSVRGIAIASLSATGTLTYEDSNRESKLLRVEGDRTTPLVADARMYAFPRYSPDGTRVAVTIGAGITSDIWMVDVASGALTRLTSGGTLNERPEWSPDGTHVLFRTSRGARSAIWWQQADGSTPAEPLLADDRHDYFEAVMTPDGRRLVFQTETADADVMLGTVGGREAPSPIAKSRATELEARVSPDGEWVAYASDETGSSQVVVRRVTGEGAKVQVSVDGGFEPVWGRDGHHLFYRGEGKFRVADVEVQPTFRVTARREVAMDDYLAAPAPHANYDVSPNGRELLVLKGAPEQLVVVHGWVSELRQRGTTPK